MLLPVVCDRQTRPARPEDPAAERNGLSTEIWELIEQTWAHHPELRPPASDLIAQLSMVNTDLDSNDDTQAGSWTKSRTRDVQEIPAIWTNRSVSLYMYYAFLD